MNDAPDWDKIGPQVKVVAFGLQKLREPFPPNQISKLPKGTKAQNDCAPNLKRKCSICGGFHHPDVIHLDYVGHAALTDRLLDADSAWSWEPMALADGLPRFDATGGLWIRLTVGGVSRIGYGNAQGKSYMDVGSREKEVIGDALRNAAMRFGAALDLWHKGDLHAEPEPEAAKAPRGSARETLQEAFDTLSVGGQEAMRARAQTLDELYAAKGINDVVNELEGWKLDADDKMALWFLLDSTLRSNIKREQARRQKLTTGEREFTDAMDAAA